MNYDDSQAEHKTNFGKVSISITVCIIGVIANLVSIFVIVVLKEYKKSVLHMYVLQLAFADILFLLTIPFKVSEDFHGLWPFGNWLCSVKETILFLNYNASVFFLVIMSIDRYIAVCQPFNKILGKWRKTKPAILTICLTWIVSLLICLPVMQNTQVVGTKPECFCQFDFKKEDFELINVCKEIGYTLQAEVATCFEHSKKAQDEGRICSDSYPDYYEELGDYYNYYEIETNRKNKTNSSTVIDLAKNMTSTSNNLTFFDEEESYYSGKGKDETDPSVDYSPGSGSATENSKDDLLYNQSINCHYRNSPLRWHKFLYTNFIVLYIFPVLAMIATYGMIIKKVKFSGGVSGSRQAKVRNKVTLMSALLVSTFIICWLPFHIIHLTKIKGLPYMQGSSCENLTIFSSLLAYINSVLNPICYSFLGTNFGKKIRRASETVRRSVTGKPSSRKLNTSTKSETAYTKARVSSRSRAVSSS